MFPGVGWIDAAARARPSYQSPMLQGNLRTNSSEFSQMMVGIISLIGVSLTINPTPVHAARKLQHRMQGKRLRLRPALVVGA